MNPKLSCMFACSKYNINCPHNAKSNTSILDHKTTGIHCEDIDLIKYNGIDIPKPYTILNSDGGLGTFKHSIKSDAKADTVEDIFQVICYQPTWLNNYFVDQLTRLYYVELCYMHRDDVVTHIVSQKDVLTTTGLKGLTAGGLNVPDSKTKALADYFGTYINDSKTMQERPIHSRSMMKGLL